MRNTTGSQIDLAGREFTLNLLTLAEVAWWVGWLLVGCAGVALVVILLKAIFGLDTDPQHGPGSKVITLWQVFWAGILLGAILLAVWASLNNNLQRGAEPTDLSRREARKKARLQAEAEAKTKNEANRKAYDAQVLRLKAKHEESVVTFRSEKEAFEKASENYPIAKLEYDAAKKLALARERFDEGRNKTDLKLWEQGRNGLDEIVKQYPDTEAAQDAKILLRGGLPKVREVPAEPVRPLAPEEPPPLVLPSPPERVAVVYPP